MGSNGRPGPAGRRVDGRRRPAGNLRTELARHLQSRHRPADGRADAAGDAEREQRPDAARHGQRTGRSGRPHPRRLERRRTGSHQRSDDRDGLHLVGGRAAGERRTHLHRGRDGGEQPRQRRRLQPRADLRRRQQPADGHARTARNAVEQPQPDRQRHGLGSRRSRRPRARRRLRAGTRNHERERQNGRWGLAGETVAAGGRPHVHRGRDRAEPARQRRRRKRTAHVPARYERPGHHAEPAGDAQQRHEPDAGWYDERRRRSARDRLRRQPHREKGHRSNGSDELRKLVRSGQPPDRRPQLHRDRDRGERPRQRHRRKRSARVHGRHEPAVGHAEPAVGAQQRNETDARRLDERSRPGRRQGLRRDDRVGQRSHERDREYERRQLAGAGLAARRRPHLHGGRDRGERPRQRTRAQPGTDLHRRYERPHGHAQPARDPHQRDEPDADRDGQRRRPGRGQGLRRLRAGRTRSRENDHDGERRQLVGSDHRPGRSPHVHGAGLGGEPARERERRQRSEAVRRRHGGSRS